MKLLFVVTAFYPEQAIGSVRITKFVKFLDRVGHDVTVLSLAPAPWAARDESLRFAALDNLRWTTVPQSRIFQHLFMRARAAAIGNRPALDVKAKPGLGGSLKARVKALAQLAYTLLKAIDWMGQVRRHVRAKLEGERFDAIFTSYPSFASPFAGLMLKRMGVSDVVMIDFRDPASYGTSSRYSFGRIVERLLVRWASVTSYASAGVFAKVAGSQLATDSRAKIVTNGFDPDDLAMIEPLDGIPSVSGSLRFAYVGSLYGGKRDLSPFFCAIAEVLKRQPELRGWIEIHYAGHEAAIFRSQASALGLDGLIVDHGRIARNASLGLQQAADVCLLATWNSLEDQGILTGKIFEFFLLRKPVLAIVNGTLAGSETKQIIAETGAGFCYEEAASDEMPALVAWIEARLREKRETRKLADHYTPQVARYDIQSMVVELFNSLNDLPQGNK